MIRSMEFDWEGCREAASFTACADVSNLFIPGRKKPPRDDLHFTLSLLGLIRGGRGDRLID